jgi:hypothetical protein
VTPLFVIAPLDDSKTALVHRATIDRIGGTEMRPAEGIVARLSEVGPGESFRSRHLRFGGVAAVWAILERLGVAGIVDEVVGARRADAPASVGTYIALATLNRGVRCVLKLAFADWWAKTAADRWLRLPAAALDHRRFWEARDAISEKQIEQIEQIEQVEQIEQRIVARMVETFSVDLSGLVLDMTNFATWIDSANERTPIAQRGQSNSNVPIFAWSGSAWSSRSTAVSRSSRTVMPGTAPTSPSSPYWSQTGRPFRGPHRQPGRFGG